MLVFLVWFSLVCLGVCLFQLFMMKCEIDWLKYENNRICEENEKLIEESLKICNCEDSIKLSEEECNCCYDLDENKVIYKGVEIDE